MPLMAAIDIAIIVRERGKKRFFRVHLALAVLALVILGTETFQFKSAASQGGG